jgi:dTDP-4-dehydrorhamnose reductase
MRVLLIGTNGQLGWELERILRPRCELTTLEYPQIDFAHPETVRPLILAARPQVILNASAYTAVDQAETETEVAYAVNRDAPGMLADAAKALGALLIHYSTDYVFDGYKDQPYSESDQPNPLNVYGASKLAGEAAIRQSDCQYLIFRLSWVYSLRRSSFVTKVLEWARAQTILRVVSDQISTPTWCRVPAQATADLLLAQTRDTLPWLNERSGLYHLACTGYASRYEWAQEILTLDPQKTEQTVRRLEPALTADFPTPALRPLFTALDCNAFTRAFGIKLPDWRTALQQALNE